jgi:hypothetical protein
VRLADFLAGTTAVADVQGQVLSDILKRNAQCNYGKVHAFGNVSGPDSYARLPYMTYDQVVGVRDYWAEPANYTTDMVAAYFLTSGSSARPKRIPVTSSLIREKCAAFSVFWDSIYQAHPNLRSGRFVANFGDSGHARRNAQNKLELSETTFWNQRMQGFQKSENWPIPRQLTAIKSAELRYFAAARLSLQGELHCLMSLNPSTLVKFCEVLHAASDRLAKGLTDGTWGDPILDGLMLPPELGGRLKANPVAADRLIQAANSSSKSFQLKELWPELELIICWQSEMVGPYLALLQTHAEGVSFRDYITQSSECIVAIPVDDHASGGLLAYQSHYYEFIAEEDADKADPSSVPAWALSEGRKYEVVVTTGGGLYRYRTGDCVRVDKMVNELPLVSFQYRLGRTSSITGEKLTEQQILQALIESGMGELLRPNRVLVYAKTTPKPSYAALVAVEDLLPGRTESDVAAWISRFHHSLCAVNGEYRDKCASLRLGRPVAMATNAAEIERLQEQDRAAHVSDEQFKPAVLRRERDIDQSLQWCSEIRADC